MTRSARRGPWLPEEDGALMSLVQSQGPNNWVRISQQIQHRSPKQCRERYHQNLKPSLKHDPISAQEGELIEQMVADMGKRWAEIARRLGNRSDNAVKNWWNGSMNRRRRNPTQISAGFKHVGARLQPIPFTSTDSNNHSYAQMLRSNRPSNDGNHWSSNPIHSSQEYQSANLQIPSPIYTHNASTTTNSPNTNFDPRPYNAAPYPVVKSKSVFPQTTTQERRPELPPIRPATYSAFPSERRLSVSERPLISPALTDISQAVSMRHAPSLVSDNHSTYSVSPKTVSSPRSGMPAHIEINHQAWQEQMTPVLPAVRLPDQRSQYSSQYSAEHGRPNVSATTQKRQHILADLAAYKDSRMHVSNLLD